MERQTVISSMVKSIGYDPMNRILEVEYSTNGAIYQYFEVPNNVYTEMMASPSVGKAIHSMIRKIYTEKKIN